MEGQRFQALSLLGIEAEQTQERREETRIVPSVLPAGWTTYRCWGSRFDAQWGQFSVSLVSTDTGFLEQADRLNFAGAATIRNMKAGSLEKSAPCLRLPWR